MSADHRKPSNRLRASWDDNAAAWTVAVREGHIPSRRAGTDAAILDACRRYQPQRMLDVGCGEGWLAHALAAPGRTVVGIDGSGALVDAANALAAEHGIDVRCEMVGYDTLALDDHVAHGPWDLIVCNFALLDEQLGPVLHALSQRLAPQGTLLIQTLHPWMAVGDTPYVSGWREETFAGFDIHFPAPMPWFYRTLGSWSELLHDAGLRLRAIEEPLHPETGRPLSLLLHGTRT